MPVIRQAALADPTGFVDYPGMMVIEEIQRVPEEVFLIKRVPAWSRNISSRAGRASKVAFADSGIWEVPSPA